MPEKTSKERGVAVDMPAGGESPEQILERVLRECEREKLGKLFDEMLVLCHRINNPLTSVLGRAQIMQLKLAGESESPYVKPVEVVEESAKRVAALVQEMANLLCVGRKVFVDRTMQDYDSSRPPRRP